MRDADNFKQIGATNAEVTTITGPTVCELVHSRSFSSFDLCIVLQFLLLGTTFHSTILQ